MVKFAHIFNYSDLIGFTIFKCGIGGSAIRNRDRCPRRRCGFHAPVRAGCCPGRTKRRAEEPPTGRARADEAAGGRAPRPGGRPPLPRAERAAQAETGIGVGFPGIGLGGAAARCATFASDGKEHRRCGRPTRNFCTHHTPHRPTGIRCRSAAGLLTAGLSSTVRPTHEKNEQP